MAQNPNNLHRRRSVLRALGVAGVGAALGPGVTSAQTDDYYAQLRSELEAEGVPGGEFVYGDSAAATLDAFSINSSGVETTEFEAEGVPFTDAVRIENTEAPANPYSYSFSADVTDRDVEVGDVLLLVAYARGTNAADVGESVKTQAGFKYRYTNPDGSTGYSTNYVQGTAQVNLSAEWKRFYFPIEVTEQPEGSEFQPYAEFWTGWNRQTTEFGGLALLDYSDTDVSVDDLPVTEFNYEYDGRAEDAAWRDEARNRIENIRTAGMDVTVVDGEGNAVEGASVEAVLQSHTFDFGSAVAAPSINGNTGDAETYRETFLENFNRAVLENAMKAPAWRGEYGASLGPDAARSALEWTEEQGVPMRGHALLWTTYDWMGVDADQSDDAISEAVAESITERAAEFEGRLPEWDMHNHPMFYDEIWQDIGQEYVLDWWEAANEADSEAAMYANEINILGSDSLLTRYDEYISWLLENDAGVDGIGFQGHFGLSSLTPPEELWSRYDQFARHDLPLIVTEFDVQINDRTRQNEVDAQADYLRDFLMASFAHEAVEGVMSWGFWASNHWRPTAAYYDEDWSLRPHGEAYRDLVLDEWHTEESGETDSEGALSFTGFKGEYELTVSADGTETTRTATLGDGGSTLEIDLSASEEDAESDGDDESGSDGGSESDASEDDGSGDGNGSTTASGGTPGFGVGAGAAALGAGALAKRLAGEDADE